MTPLEKTAREDQVLLSETKPEKVNAATISLDATNAAETTHDLRIELRERAEETLQFIFDGPTVNIELQNRVTTPQGVIDRIRNQMRLMVEAPRIAA